MTTAKDDLPARAAYQAACDARGVRPNWGPSGYQSQAERWRAVAAAARSPEEPPSLRPVQPERTPIAEDLSDLRIPMSRAIAILVRVFDVGDADRSRFVGNVKHYQRNGFPHGMEVRGRGTAAMLGRTQLLQLAICETLHRAGVMPIQAMRMTMAAWSRIEPCLPSLLSTDGGPPVLLATSIDRNEESVDVVGIEAVEGIVAAGTVRSVSIHRLDIVVRLVRTIVLGTMYDGPARIVDRTDLEVIYDRRDEGSATNHNSEGTER